MEELKEKVEAVVNIEGLQVGIKNGTCLSTIVLVGAALAAPLVGIAAAPIAIAATAGAAITLSAVIVDRVLQVKGNLIQNKEW